VVPLGLRGTGPWRHVWAYVDSGAIYSIFDAGTAEILGLELRTGKQRFAVVGDGGAIPFYLHPVTIQLGSDRFRLEMGFSDRLGVGFNLMGLDVFSRYRVTFDGRVKRVSFTRLR
jgi:hypothetical protein